jgi:hypothetical protein
MEFENQQFEVWKKWAKAEAQALANRNSAMAMAAGTSEAPDADEAAESEEDVVVQPA